MATERGFGRLIFIGLWVSFIGVIFMYWNAVSTTGELIVVLDELNSRVAEVNATLEELHQELRGSFGGCIAQCDALKSEKKSYVEALPLRDKTIAEKTDAAKKAAENLKKVQPEHAKANETLVTSRNQLEACERKCNETAIAECKILRDKAAAPKSFLEKLFQRS